jgi:signal transduction histidine kinase
VEDVLALARADAASGHLNLAAVDVRTLVENAIATFLPAIKKRSLTVDLDAPQGPVTIRADRDRLIRVVRNLIDNAVRYAPESSRITAAITVPSGSVRVEFTNRATDLNAVDLPYLFERFYRGEKSRSRHHGGAGIGLSIVKELVEAHGGGVHAAMADGRVHIGFTLPPGKETTLPPTSPATM